MSSFAYALARAELIRSLTAYSGITTSDGAADGTTLVDSNLIDRNEFISEKTILIMSGAAKDEDKGALSFVPATGIITLQGTGFSAQIKAGTIFRVLNISTVEMDVASIDGKIGTNADLAGTTTLFAWLAKLFAQGGQGGFYYGKVTQVDDGTNFRVSGLAGIFDDAYFANTYRVYVVRDAAGLGAAPQGEMQPCSGSSGTNAIFTHTAFTVGLAVDDEVLLIHERIAEIADLVTMLGTGQYYDRIFYDEDTGVAGTAWPTGTPQVPSDVIADIITMCTARKLHTISVHGALTLGATMQHYNFVGYEHEDIADILDLSDEDVDGSHIEGLIVTGGQGGASFLTLVRCIANAVTLFNGRMSQCSFWGGVTSSFKDGGYIDLIDCDSIYGAVTITVQAPTRASIKNWRGNLILTAQDGGVCLVRGFKGTLEIDAMTAGTLNVYANGADITINADCTGGTINIYGNANVTGAGGGVTINNYTLDDKIGTAADAGDLATLFGKANKIVLPTHAHALLVVHDASSLDADLDTALKDWMLDLGHEVTIGDPADVAVDLDLDAFDFIVVSGSCVVGDAGNLANLREADAPVLCHSAAIAVAVFFLGGTAGSEAAQTQIEITENSPAWLIDVATGDLTVTASATIQTMATKATNATTKAEEATGTGTDLTIVKLKQGEQDDGSPTYAAFYDRYFNGVADYTNANAAWKAIMAGFLHHMLHEKRFGEGTVQLKRVPQEQIPDTDFALAAIDNTLTADPPSADAENSIVDLDERVNLTYVLRSLWVNVTSFGTAGTQLTFQLWVLLNGVVTSVDSVVVDALGIQNLMDIFGLQEVHADGIWITVITDSGSADAACSGTYRYAEARK
ncbi:hypothetical protein ES703_17307 [subsurface metagenome]